MILFSAIEYEDCLAAYNWHRGFAGANDALFPREYDSFQTLVLEGCVWTAKNTAGDYLAMAYASYDEVEKICEIGGLMVAASARGKGLGLVIMRLALTHALLEEGHADDLQVRIVAHVLKGNNAPRRIIEEGLCFRFSKPVEIPASALPGLRADPDGVIRGDEYEFDRSAGLASLGAWARTWKGTLMGDEIADIEHRHGIEMSDWATALEELATRHG